MQKTRKLILIIIVVILMFLIQGCQQKSKMLILATTTSTYDSGLLDYLLPDFERKYNTKVKIISVGTGQALKNAENGDVDIILVHIPALEKRFVEQGHGINRKCVMYNDFIILGPEEDPASIKGKDVETALQTIASMQKDFVSRGDDSGTHKKEKELWSSLDLEPGGELWYFEVGLGMGDTLRIVNEKQAYTLSDRGTYISQKHKLQLTPLVEDDKMLINPYGIITVNPKKYPDINVKGAEEFTTWIMSEETQKAINEFQKEGEVLFKPLRGECIGG
ncbi:MAG: substrate-binding domain-containing protein [Nanoarchaeota archaeon]|nr:substrate-binding domain-containing protein [Nanoarchaeota archaeon]MBU1321940.1 substrate-binding domain-containing protein [Nanoarchaeota archaeon]MBU1597936.1 substrate-binding domain-containing protein [Nanoarchaeota archaeon]